MTWTKDFMTSLDVFNVSSGLNLTNQHLANITRQVQTDLVKMNLLPNVTLPEMQKVIDHFDVFNVTKLDIFNMTALDIFNVSKLDIFNMTKLDLFNVTHLDIFNVTNFDLFNATKQTLMDNPILDQLKTLAKESLNRNSTRFSSKEDVDASDNSVEDQDDLTTPSPNFLMERIKELQSIQTGFGSSLKNILGPMGFKEPPVKMKDLRLAMTIIPKLMPYVLEANTPKLKTIVKVGTRFTLNELYQIHTSLKDLHKFVSKIRDTFVREKAPTLIKMTDMVIDKNVKLMRTILVLMVRADRADRADKSVLLTPEDIEELQEYLVSPSDIYSILAPQN